MRPERKATYGRFGRAKAPVAQTSSSQKVVAPSCTSMPLASAQPLMTLVNAAVMTTSITSCWLSPLLYNASKSASDNALGLRAHLSANF